MRNRQKMKNYKNYLDEWCNGLSDEMLYWEDYLKTDGGDYREGFIEYVQIDKKFELEEYLPDSPNQLINFVDVGSGPFSTCGYITQKVNLRFTAIDPLAHFYNQIKNKYAYNNGIIIQTGFVELLDKHFNENSFDIVHMRNALDHCFDPMHGILQLLRICKKGGIVILCHYENEAENEDYTGLHQWNLSAKMKPGRYIIWNKKESYDLEEQVGRFAQISIQNKTVKNKNVVILRKQKNFDIPYMNYDIGLLNVLFDKLLDIYNKINHDKGKIERVEVERMERERRFARLRRRIEFLSEDKIYEVSIYGGGKQGQIVYDICRKLGVQVRSILDKRKFNCQGITTKSPEEYKEEYKGEIILLTVYKKFTEIKEDLLANGYAGEKIVDMSE